MYLFHMVPMNPTFPYESWSDCRLAILCSSCGRLRASRLANRCAADDCKRSETAKTNKDVQVAGICVAILFDVCCRKSVTRQMILMHVDRRLA